MDGSFRYECTLDKVNDFSKSRAHSISHNFENNIVNSVAKANWSKMASRCWITHFWDQGYEHLINLLEEFSFLKKGSYCSADIFVNNMSVVLKESCTKAIRPWSFEFIHLEYNFFDFGILDGPQ